MRAVTEIRNGAEAATEAAAEIRAEIPRYREMAETVTGIVVLTASLIALTCLVIIAKNMVEITRAT